jgi:hypothetical protein
LTAKSTDVIAANRGNKDYWPGCQLHHGKFLFSSMPWGDTGKWLLDEAAYYERDGQNFGLVRERLIGLQLEFVDARSMKTREELYEEILSLSAQLRFYPSPTKLKRKGKEVAKGMLYSEANIFDNIQNLGIPYLEEQRRELSDFMFLIEILNQRPKSVEAGFYPKLAPHHAQECPDHAYVAGLEFNLSKLSVHDSRMDGDCRSHQAIRMSVDWGATISTMLLGQVHADVGEYRFLKGLYVKHPKLIKDLAKLFTTYYATHLNKTVELIQDNEWGNKRSPDSKLTYNEQLIEELRAAGWRVRVVDQGRAPDYAVRYKLAMDMLGETDNRQLRIRFNKVNCRDVLMALSMAPLRQGSKGQIEKDKSSEKRKTTPAQEATHYTDNFDQHLISIDKYVAKVAGSSHGLLIVSA